MTAPTRQKLTPDRSLALLTCRLEAIWDPRHDFERSRGAFTVCRQAHRPQSMQSPAIRLGLNRRHGTTKTAGLDVLRSEETQQRRGVSIFSLEGDADPGTCYLQARNLIVFGAELELPTCKQLRRDAVLGVLYTCRLLKDCGESICPKGVDVYAI